MYAVEVIDQEVKDTTFLAYLKHDKLHELTSVDRSVDTHNKYLYANASNIVETKLYDASEYEGGISFSKVCICCRN